MNASPLPIRYQLCLVGFRRVDGRLQFRLVTQPGQSRWSFPQAAATSTDFLPELRQLALNAGVLLSEEQVELLDQVDTSRRDDYDQLVAMLAAVEEASEQPANSSWRSRWCFVEEARVRIRRKPLRRLIDLAVRRIEADSEETEQ